MSCQPPGEARGEADEGAHPLACGVPLGDLLGRARPRLRDRGEILAVIPHWDGDLGAHRECCLGARGRREPALEVPESEHARVDAHEHGAGGGDELEHAGRSFAHCVRELHRSDGVAVHAQRVDAHAHRRAVERRHLTVGDDALGPVGDLRRVGDDRSRQPSRGERAVGEVGAVREGFAHESHASARAGRLDGGERRAEHGQRERRGGLRDDVGDDRVDGHARVEGAVRLDVGDARADALDNADQGPHLVQEFRAQLLGRHLHVPPPEPDAIAVRRMRADRHPVSEGRTARREQAQRIPGVETAGEVRARHERQHRRVVAHRPGTEGFAEVAVEVDVRHPPSLRLRGRRVTGRSAAT